MDDIQTIEQCEKEQLTLQDCNRSHLEDPLAGWAREEMLDISDFHFIRRIYEENASATTIDLMERGDSQYILKKVLKSRLFSQSLRDSAARELEIYSSLSHKNIVSLIQAEETSDAYVYLLEYLPEATYFVEKLEVNNSPLMLKPSGHLQKLKSIASDILAGLSYLHSTGVVHLDIKPANLLVSTEVSDYEFPVVKICDFGLARQLDDNGNTRIPARCGSEGYIAPEVRDGATITSAADIWSFGVFLHLLAFGYLPTALNWKRNEPLPKVKRHWMVYENTCLEDLITRCLQRDPKQRVTAKQALAHSFFCEK